MDTRIQFRVDEETKRLAQLMAESQGRSLSDAWVTEQVNLAFEKMENGSAEFVSNKEANAQMEDFKTKIRARR
jgi:uncharacterized protein (DUF1778 family)